MFENVNGRTDGRTDAGSTGVLLAHHEPLAQVRLKIWFEFLYVQDLWPRSRNDLDLQYSHTFIYIIRCLLLPTFRSLAAIVSEKSTVFTFSHRKA